MTQFAQLRETLRSPLARRLILAIALFSVVIGLLLTAFYLKKEYTDERNAITAQLDAVEHVQLPAIAQSMWTTNQQDIALLLQGMVWPTHIEYAAVEEDGKTVISSGARTSTRFIERRFPVIYAHRGQDHALGTLVVVADLDALDQKLKERLIAIVGQTTAATLFLATIAFVLLHRLVTRHIVAVAEYVRTEDLKQSSAPLQLRRAPHATPDELDELATAINSMQSVNRAALAASHRSAAQIRLLLESTEEGIYGVDTNGVCIFANAAALRMLGYRDESDLIGKNIHALIHHSYPDGRPYPKEECQERLSTLRGQMAHSADEVHWRADGSSFPVEYWSHPTYQDGQLVGAVVTFMDITERKKSEADRNRLQAQLLQVQKMEAIGHLTGGIAHDFNNMLGAMLGYAELLKFVRAGQPAGSKEDQYIDEIMKAGQRAKELISQMLVFSRLSPELHAGAVPTIRLQPVIKEVVNLLRSSIPSSIEIGYQVADESLKVRIPPVQLHQIVLNLVINARDAIDDYGRIEVNVSRRFVAGACDSCHATFSGDYVELAVSDNGKGFSPALLQKIFDPFFTTKDVGKGTGMGLAVVHGIVHAMNGHVMATSEERAGTTMRVYLPAATGAGTSEPAVESSPAGLGVLQGVRAMVVDDEPSMASMLVDLLGEYGAHAIAYTHAPDALAAFERDPSSVDVVITDATMPHLSGLDLTKALLKMRPALPVILCTGYSVSVNEEIAKQGGVSAFLQKPMGNTQLVDTVAKLTHRMNT